MHAAAGISTGQVQVIWQGAAQLGEGCLWSEREQALYWVDILGRTLYRCQPQSGVHASWSFSEEVSALTEAADGGGLLLTLRHGFAWFDPLSARLTRWVTAESDRPGNRFNDAKCDAAGRFWASTIDFQCEQATGALYRLHADGRCEAMRASYVVNNGPTWSLDGRTLYLNDTVQGRVQAFDFDPHTGTLANERTWLQLAAGDGLPDGMTTDAQGRLWIAHWGGACVTCHDPHSAAELARIALPTSHITNCVFGGDGLRSLFITSARVGLSAEQLLQEPLAGAVFRVDTNVQGLPAPLFGRGHH